MPLTPQEQLEDAIRSRPFSFAGGVPQTRGKAAAAAAAVAAMGQAGNGNDDDDDEMSPTSAINAEDAQHRPSLSSSSSSSALPTGAAAGQQQHLHPLNANPSSSGALGANGSSNYSPSSIPSKIRPTIQLDRMSSYNTTTSSSDAVAAVAGSGGGGGNNNNNSNAAGQQSASGASNTKTTGKQGGASDFVKKLYRMLEEDAYKAIVAWGAKGDTFVVKDMNEFTKTVLPQHFKHSNFASFVRQLNKYDFHKVKNPESNQDGTGENYWEFKHPSFTIENKGSMENIKRKITTSKKPETPAAINTSNPFGVGPGLGGPLSARLHSAGAVMPSGNYSSDIDMINRQIQVLSQNQNQIEMHIDRFTAQYHSLMADVLGQHRAIAAQDAFTATTLQYIINLESRLLAVTNPGEIVSFPPSAEAQQLMSTYSDLSRARYDKMTETTRRAEALGLFVNGSGIRRPDSPLDGTDTSSPDFPRAVIPAYTPGLYQQQQQPQQAVTLPQPQQQQSQMYVQHYPQQGSLSTPIGPPGTLQQQQQQQQQQGYAPPQDLHHNQQSQASQQQSHHQHQQQQAQHMHHPQPQHSFYTTQQLKQQGQQPHWTASPASSVEESPRDSNRSFANFGEIRLQRNDMPVQQQQQHTSLLKPPSLPTASGIMASPQQISTAQPTALLHGAKLEPSGMSYFPAPGSGPIRPSMAITPGAVMISTLNGGLRSPESREESADDSAANATTSLTLANTARNQQQNTSSLLDDGEDIANFAAALKGGQSSAAVRSALTSQPLLVRRATYIPGWSVPPRVLLVEDDPVCRNLTTKFLQLFGCTIEVAADGVEAVGKMQSGVYDICMMDISMPNLDGVSATSLIRQFDAMTPIISMTGNSRPDEVLTYFSHGMNDVLPKPFTKEGILSMLEKHLLHLKQFHLNPDSAPTLDNVDGDTLDPNVNPFQGLGLSNEDYAALLSGSGNMFGFRTPSYSPSTAGATSSHATALGKRLSEIEGDNEATKRTRFQDM